MKTILTLMLSLLLQSIWHPATAAIRLAEQQICTSVVERAPQGSDSTFRAEVGTLTCFTKVDGANAPTTIEHVWYHGEEEMARISLKIGAAAWRTWSTKKILPHWNGAWRVDVVDAEGEVIGSRDFLVSAPTADGAQETDEAPKVGQ